MSTIDLVEAWTYVTQSEHACDAHSHWTLTGLPGLVGIELKAHDPCFREVDGSMNNITLQ